MPKQASASFFKDCNHCHGRGEVPPNSPVARTPANMTGEVVDRTKSVCKKCSGTGNVCPTIRQNSKITRDEWAAKYDQQSRKI